MAAGDNVHWIGTDGNLANTANYSVGGVPLGALPGADTNLFFDGGSGDINQNLTALSAIALRSVQVTPAFKWNIGAAGQSIVLKVDHANSTGIGISMGGQYIYASITFAITGSVGYMTIGSTGPGAFYLTGGTFANEVIAGGSTGKCYILSGVTMGDVYTAGCSMDVTPAFATANLKGGNNVLRGDVTTLNLGTNAGCTLEGSGVDVTTANVEGGARLILNNGGETVGVVTTVNAYPGSYVANGGKYANTITTLNQWAGSTQVLQTPNAKTTVTNPIVPIGQK